MKTRKLTEIAILVAMAIVLEVIFTGLGAFFPILQLPYGGRISLSMLPLFIITYRQGMVPGIIGGVIYGILNLLLDGQLWHWASLPLDYIIAFGVLGVGYVGVVLLGKNFKGFSLMVVIGILLRFLSHWLSGWILFSDYMPEEFTNAKVYSLIYNGYYLLPSMLLIIIVAALLFKKLQKANIFE
jgi:thiamine transporter